MYFNLSKILIWLWLLLLMIDENWIMNTSYLTSSDTVLCLIASKPRILIMQTSMALCKPRLLCNLYGYAYPPALQALFDPNESRGIVRQLCNRWPWWSHALLWELLAQLCLTRALQCLGLYPNVYWYKRNQALITERPILYLLIMQWRVILVEYFQLKQQRRASVSRI